MLGSLLLVVLIGMAASQKNPDDVIKYDEIIWAFHVADGSNVTMQCGDSNKNITFEGDETLQWARVTYKENSMVLTAIESDTNKYMYEPMEQGGLEKFFFSVINVQKQDHGLYLCTARNGTTDDVIIQFQKGINFRREPFVTDLIVKYRNHIITSVVATAIALALILGGCCIHRFRCTKEASSKSYTLNGDHSAAYNSESKGYDNPTVATGDENNGYDKSTMEMKYRGGANGTEETGTEIF